MDVKGENNEFYRNLSSLVDGTERTIRESTHNYIALIDDAVNYVEASLYSNLIRLYQHNLNDAFFERVKMNPRDREDLLALLQDYFERARATSEGNYNEGEVDFHLYQEFRSAIYDFGDDAYWLLLGMERYADLIACEHRLITFKRSMNELKRKSKSRPAKARTRR